MKHTTRFLLILAVTASVASTLTVPSFAGKADITPASSGATVSGGPTQDSWVGGAGAIGCGFGIRYRILGGLNPWITAGTVVMCLIMLADGIRS